MKGNKSSIGGFLFRTIGFLLVGVMLNVVFLNTISTNAWFTDEMSTSMEVTAASTKDIITDVRVEKVTNPENILIVGSTNLLDREAMIYFGVEGDMSNYILHINPVTIKADKSYSIPIEPNINIFQYTSLLEFPWQNGKVTGNIKIKYLNEFINENIPITFTKRYLRSILIDEIQRKEVGVFNVNENKEITNEVIEMIGYLASHLEWEDNNNLKALRNTPSIMTKMSTKTLNEDSEVSNIVLEEVPYIKLELNEEQSKVIDIISPTLRSYLADLYGTIESLVQNINDKIIKIFELEQEVVEFQNTVEDYQKTVDDLNTQIEEKNNEIKRLNVDNLGLNDQIISLESDKDDLRNEIRDLKNHRCPTIEIQSNPIVEPKPVVAAPTPADPDSTTPTPADPDSTTPTPADPDSTTPTPADPDSTTPTPANPDSTTPTPANPDSTAPTSTDPDSTVPAPIDPVQSESDSQDFVPLDSQ